jgi:crotonobetainyl-CoA:carnitine CoA-transferase CaiB-like acyl-CoA transferase
LAGNARFETNTLRVTHRGELVPHLEGLMRTRTTTQWQDALTSVDVPHAPVWNYAQLLSHPQAAARGLRVEVRDPQGRPVDLVGTPFHIQGEALPELSAPPALGQHTEEILQQFLGLDPGRIADLRQRGIV